MQLNSQRSAIRRTATAVALLALAAPAMAQKSDAEIRRDIDFARGLASRWTFVDLAEKVLARIEKQGVSDRMATELALVKCNIFASGAAGARTPERRNELFEQALDAYDQFLTDFPQSARQDEAEIGLVAVSAKYARSLALRLEDEVGEEADATRSRQEEVLLEAVALTGDLISNLKTLLEQEELPETGKRKLYDLMLDRGVMLLEIAKTQEDGSANFIYSMNTLEELVFTAGEGTPYALRAYNAMGDNYAAQGQWEDASIFYREVVNQAIPIDQDEWNTIVEENELTQGAKEVRWLFVQLGTEGLISALRNNGQTMEAVQWGLHLFNTQRREGFSYIPQGYLSLLEGARALLDAGGFIGGRLNSGEAQWFATSEELEAAGFRPRERASAIDLALRIAETVNRDNPGNNLKVRAQRLISEVINRPGVEVAPDVLLEAAMGAYNERDYAEAVGGFRRVLRAIEGLDETQQLLYAPKTLYHLGRCFYQLDRPLEAAVTYQEGCTRFKGDPEFDEKNATQFYNHMRALSRDVPEADAFKQLSEEAAQIVQETDGVGASGIVFRDATRLREEKEFGPAIAKYKQIAQGDNEYEKALVYIAVCELGLGNLDKAVGELERYIGPFLDDPANATTSPSKLQKRKEARAVAFFYRGFITNMLATEGTKGWQDVVTLLESYAKDFPEQDKFGPFADRMVALAHLELGDTDAVRARLELMIARFPESKHTAFVAIKLYSALAELHAAAEKEGNAEATSKLLREMAELMKLSNANDRTPDWANLRRESSHWLDLDENEEAERVLRKIAAMFTEERGEDVQKYVKPDLADALLRQHKTAEAFDFLQPLVATAESRPSKRVAVAYTRSLVGWVDWSKEATPPFTVIPGAGGDDEVFKKATEYLKQISNSVEKYGCEWVGLKFNSIYAYYVWGQKDTRHLETAKNLIKTIRTDFGSGFEDIESRCGEDGSPELGEELRRKYSWLGDKLK
jgi:hypothetical protein